MASAILTSSLADPAADTIAAAARRGRNRRAVVVSGLIAAGGAALLSCTWMVALSGAGPVPLATALSFAIAALAGLLLGGLALAGRHARDRARVRAALEAARAAASNARSVTTMRTRQLESILAGMSDGVMVLDHDLRIVQWNERYPLYAGVPPGTLRVGIPLHEVILAQARAGEFGVVDVEAEVVRRMASLISTGHSVSFERTRPNGRALRVQRTSLPGGGYVTVFTDITALRQTEAAQAEARRHAEEIARQKSRFVAIVSHEMRTPLNAVVNGLTLLEQSVLAPAPRRLAQAARRAGDVLLDLVDDVLELSSLDAGGLTLRPGPVDVRALLDGVVEMFEPGAGQRGLRLMAEVADDVPPQITIDGGRLRQIMINLVGNAAKFAEPGAIVARAAVVPALGGPTLLLGVRDPGPTIGADEALRLFQPFSRGDPRETGTPGTGLGLAICEHLTRLMGGRIGMAPAAEGGKEFWLTVPLVVPVPALQSAAPGSGRFRAAPWPGARRRRALVLLVDDDLASRLLVATLLRRQGHRVDVAASGAEAIHLARTRPQDVILLDLMMPGMGGIEAATRIRALHGPAASTPIVALTAYSAAEDLARCLAVGMLDLLSKPVPTEALFAMVDSAAWRRPVGVDAATRAGPLAAGAVEIAPPGPPVDARRLAELRHGLSPDTLAGLVEQCLDDIRQRLPLLRQGLAAGNARAVEAVAHTLAGLAATYGLGELDRRTRAIVTAARHDDLGRAAEAALGLDEAVDRASVAIRAMMRTAVA